MNVGFGIPEGYNTASSLALRNAITGTFPNYSLDFSKVLVSSGSLPQSHTVTVTKLTGTQVEVKWDPSVWTNGSPVDLVHVAFLNAETKMLVYDQAQATRSQGILEIHLPEVWLGANVHVWFFFTTTDGRQSSVSQYLGILKL